MNLGRLFGLIFFILGIILAAIGYAMFLETNSVIKLCFAAPTLILLGISLLIFPGYYVPVKEHRNKAKQLEVFFKAPVLHKIVWIMSFIIGIAGTLVLIINTFEI